MAEETARQIETMKNLLRRLAIAAVAILLGCAVAFAALWHRSHIDLAARIRSLVGDQAVDCGYVPPGANPDRADACALQQFNGSTPFWVRYGQRGIDSHIEFVFMRTGSGRLLWLWYDSDVTGSGSTLFGKPRVFERPCSGKVIEAGGHQRFTCE